ncbi:hypothetical protein PF002_g28143 [Phytophthora fragariae]|uniref:FAD/NAD(P)-binding domain-containing protein n=1 Tax=Phytophthora fragariae TaxID=53985 RepID=A0A6A3W4R4_9STRA|nr:hypothetical protein PF002_g28143 [Phytophthora fragariae]
MGDSSKRDGRFDILSFCDREIIRNLTYEMQSNGARFLLGEAVKKVETTDNRVKVFFESGRVLSADALLYTVGHQASTNGLNTGSNRTAATPTAEYVWNLLNR